MASTLWTMVLNDRSRTCRDHADKSASMLIRWQVRSFSTVRSRTCRKHAYKHADKECAFSTMVLNDRIRTCHRTLVRVMEGHLLIAHVNLHVAPSRHYQWC